MGRGLCPVTLPIFDFTELQSHRVDVLGSCEYKRTEQKATPAKQYISKSGLSCLVFGLFSQYIYLYARFNCCT